MQLISKKGCTFGVNLVRFQRYTKRFSRFICCHPVKIIPMNDLLLSKVEQSLNTIRPHLRSDGGDIEIVRITDDNVLLVRWLGTCVSCPMSFMTMRAGIEQAVKTAVPEISAVEAVNSIGLL